MSSIDVYNHQRLGWIRCLIDKPPRYYVRVAEIAIYRLLEDTEIDGLQAKKGDILVGGGSGEWGCFRISFPTGVRFALDMADSSVTDDRSKLYGATWSWSVAYALCAGFEKVGWRHDEDIETWLAEHVAGFAASIYPQFFPDIDASKAPANWQALIRADFQEKMRKSS